MKPKDPNAARKKMVKRQIAGRGVKDPHVLQAMRKVPREAFLSEALQDFAYEDTPLPIGEGQTISQPYMVAYMIEALALRGGEKVLEIGTGSGYAAAVLGEIAAEVFSIERIDSLADMAQQTLHTLGYDNVHVICGDGTRGLPENAPFDAIAVAAGGPTIPESLKTQLKTGGRLVIPIGPNANKQELAQVTRVSETDYETKYIAHVRFVPLIGEEGWNSTNESGHQ